LRVREVIKDSSMLRGYLTTRRIQSEQDK